MKKLMIMNTISILTPLLSRGEGEPNIAETPEFKAALATAMEGVKAEFQTSLQSEVDKVTSGLKTKNEELIGKMKAAQDAAKKFDGMDADKVSAMMKAMENNEDMKLLAEGKFEDVLAKRTDKLTAEFTEKVNALTAQLETATGNETKYKTTLQNNTIKDSITKQALAAGLLPEALADVVRRGLDVFSIDEKGEIEARNSNGELLQIDGKLQTPERFIEGLKKEAPYYWGASQSANANGNNDKKNNSDKGGDATALTDVVGTAQSSFDLEKYRAARKANSGDNYNHG